MAEGPKKILIFTGAGIGVPLKLPTTVDFIKDVKDHAMPITDQVITSLNNPDNSRSKDIEWILSTLQEFSTGSGLTKNIASACAAGLGQASYVEYIKTQFDIFKKDASSEIKRIKQIIFNQLKTIDKNQARSLYENLLLQLNKKYGDSSFSLITTNYDLSFETAILAIGEDGMKKLGINNINYGFKQDSFSGISTYDSVETFNWDVGQLEYLKVHGSLDWNQDTDQRCVRSGSTTTPAYPDEMVILYPGAKGVPSNETFISLHSRLLNRLLAADVVFVIGFAFRDEYINSIFDIALRQRSDLNIYYFNPIALDKDPLEPQAHYHPKESQAPRLVKKYPNFRHQGKDKGITVSETPLDLSQTKD